MAPGRSAPHDRRMPLGEIAAVARQGWLIGARALGLSDEAPRAPEATHAVAFIHGFFAAGPVFDPLRTRVEAQGMATLDLTYPWTGTFERIADVLASRLHEAAAGRRLALVGHSLGGIFARWVVAKHGVPAETLVTIATPHAGTEIARRWPLPLARALRPDSAVLAQLDPPPIPHLAIVAGRDRMVRPPGSAAAAGARVHWLPDVGHNAVLFDPEAHRLVIDELQSWRRGVGAHLRSDAAE